MFVYEGNGENERLRDYFDAVYWAVITSTTVGYGDVYPITTVGKFIASISAILGIAFHGLFIGVLGSGFIDEMKKNN
jgi:voltage-gated potassium channel